MKYSVDSLKWFEKANWVYLKIFLKRLENYQKLRNKYDEINYDAIMKNVVRYDRDNIYDGIILEERKLYETQSKNIM